MIVVFEGADGAGKSTMIEAVAAEALKDGIESAVWHAGPFPEGSNPWSEYVFPLSNLQPSTGWMVLIDRWHVGELVYGPIFRGQSRLSHAQRGWIDRYLSSIGALQVYLTASHDELSKRLTARGDPMVKVEHLQPILDGYAAVVNGMRVHDTTGQRPGPTASSIYTAARIETAKALSALRHPCNDDRPFWERNQWPS